MTRTPGRAHARVMCQGGPAGAGALKMGVFRLFCGNTILAALRSSSWPFSPGGRCRACSTTHPAQIFGRTDNKVYISF